MKAQHKQSRLATTLVSGALFLGGLAAPMVQANTGKPAKEKSFEKGGDLHIGSQKESFGSKAEAENADRDFDNGDGPNKGAVQGKK